MDFLCSEEECTKGLDNSHTPPAPLMTKSQQKIVALLVDLEEAKPTMFHIVQAGIEYKLFRLNQTTEVCHFFTILTCRTEMDNAMNDSIIFVFSEDSHRISF